jgi:hypothetical protein
MDKGDRNPREQNQQGGQNKPRERNPQEERDKKGERQKGRDEAPGSRPGRKKSPWLGGG